MNFSQLVNRFVYRDIIYIFSGSIIIFYFGYIFYDKTYLDYLALLELNFGKYSTNFIFIFLFCGLAYVFALFSQILLKYFLPTQIVDNQAEYQNKIKVFLSENQHYSNVIENYERIVNFKQIGTTFGSSLIISCIFFIIRFFLLIFYFKQINCNLIIEFIITILVFITSISFCFYLNIGNKKFEKDILRIDA